MSRRPPLADPRPSASLEMLGAVAMLVCTVSVLAGVWALAISVAF